MSFRSPLRSHYTLAIFLWLSMAFLIWQHYHGLSQISGKPVDRGIDLATSQSSSSSSNARLDEKELSRNPPGRASHEGARPPAAATANAIDAFISSVEKTSLFFVNESPQPAEFSKMGGRLQILETWVSARSTLVSKMTQAQQQSLENHIERTLLTLFPFIRHPAQPKNTQPFTTLRSTFIPKSQAIVMVGSKDTLHSLAHTILNIRIALNSSLPIQVFHAGETDFPSSARRFIKRLSHDITTHDVKTFLTDSSIVALEAGGPRAIRAFSALATTFSQLVLIRPGITFLQPPEVLFSTAYPSFPSDVGALFFHSPLFGKGDNKPAHKFWQSHFKNHPESPALRSSRTYNEGYAEEADAGVVVLDKSRLSTLMGLLHTCWQNTKKVREEFTYKYAGDERDSWWFGFELASAPYAWGGGYGGIIGWLQGSTSSSRALVSSPVPSPFDESQLSSKSRREFKSRICGKTVLHLDSQGLPLWYSGGLLQPHGDTEYDVPEQWMVGGVWQGAREGQELDCMWGGELREVSRQEKAVLEKSIIEAENVDEKVHKVVQGEQNRAEAPQKEK